MIKYNEPEDNNELLYDEPKGEYFYSKLIFLVISIVCIGIAIFCSYIFIINIKNLYFWVFLLFGMGSIMIGYQLIKNLFEERPFRITSKAIYLREKKFQPIKIQEITRLEWRNNKNEQPHPRWCGIPY